MVKPLISVVVVTYNQEKYIQQTLDSILAQQTDFDFEIVVGEDCSTDNTRDKVFSYQQKYPERIKVVTSDLNVGLLKNYYRTIQHASGKYIACCAGDDYWHASDKLQAQVSVMENDPEYGLVHSGATLIDEKGKFIKRMVPSIRELNPNDDPLLDLLVGAEYPVFASTAVFRKNLFDHYFNLDELIGNGIVMEDTPFLNALQVGLRIRDSLRG